MLITVPIERLRQTAALSALASLLAFILFASSLLWDQWLWMAALALPVGCLTSFFALWCLGYWLMEARLAPPRHDASARESAAPARADADAARVPHPLP